MTTAPPTVNQPLPEVPGLVFRPMGKADAQPWLQMVQRIARFDEAPWHDQLSDLTEVLGSSTNAAAENTVAGVDGDGELRAYGYVSKTPGSSVGFAFGGVDPLWRRRGIGRAILLWQRAVLETRLAAEGAEAPLVRSYVQEVTPGHAELLRSAGFVPVRTFIEMARGLAQTPVARPIPGISVRAFDAEFTEAVRLAHNEAFADHWGSEGRSVERWATLMGHESFRREWSSIAVEDATGEVAGYQMSMFDPTLQAASGFLDGYTELLGVRRAFRGRGIAPALLVDAMERYKGAGMERACLDVDTENPSGALGLYERMGYRSLPRRSSMAWDLAL